MSSFSYILFILFGLRNSIWGNQEPSGFRVVLSWPPALCKIDPSKCSNLVREFTLHGMWPYDAYGSSMIDCYNGTSDFNVTNLSPATVSALNAAWPSFGGGNVGFWRYQWNKHGRCAESVLSFEDYFKTAVIMRDFLKLEDTLAKSGINHNNGFYEVQDILNSLLFDEYDATPSLHKSKVKCETVKGEVLLYEIWICIDKRGLTNCPGGQQANCGGLNALVKYLA